MNEHARAKAQLYEFVTNELPDELRQRIESHIASCNECSNEVQALSSFLGEVDRSTVDWSAQLPPGYWNAFAHSVEEKIAQEKQQAGIIQRVVEWIEASVSFRPRDIAIASAVCAVVLVALIAGKQVWERETPVVKPSVAQQDVPAVDSEYIRMHDYFARSRTLLVGLANLKTEEGEPVNLNRESAMSRNLLRETRIIKMQPLDSRSERLISDMEIIFIKVANSQNDFNSPNLHMIRKGIERENLIYKIRRAEATYNPQYMMAANDKERLENQ